MRIAVIGSGVSGLVAAYLLHDRHDVVVFEARDRIGGHTHTVVVPDVDGRQHAVDTGFIVFNETNYPLFCRLLEKLGVASQPSEMSFSVRCDESGLEYNGSTLRQLFVQPSNLLRPSYHRMLLDILRFNRRAQRDLEAGLGDETLGGYLARHRFSERLGRHYLVPMGSALWSTPPGEVLDMPVAFFARLPARDVGTTARSGASSAAGPTDTRRPSWRPSRTGSGRRAPCAPSHATKITYE